MFKVHSIGEFLLKLIHYEIYKRGTSSIVVFLRVDIYVHRYGLRNKHIVPISNDNDDDSFYF